MFVKSKSSNDSTNSSPTKRKTKTAKDHTITTTKPSSVKSKSKSPKAASGTSGIQAASSVTGASQNKLNESIKASTTTVTASMNESKSTSTITDEELECFHPEGSESEKNVSADRCDIDPLKLDGDSKARLLKFYFRNEIEPQTDTSQDTTILLSKKREPPSQAKPP